MEQNDTNKSCLKLSVFLCSASWAEHKIRAVSIFADMFEELRLRLKHSIFLFQYGMVNGLRELYNYNYKFNAWIFVDCVSLVKQWCRHLLWNRHVFVTKSNTAKFGVLLLLLCFLAAVNNVAVVLNLWLDSVAVF